MRMIPNTKLYNKLANKLSKETAENPTGVIEHKISKELKKKPQILSIKDDMSGIKVDISRLELMISETKLELGKEIANTKAELGKEIANTKAELSKEIGNSKADILKWVISIWITTILMFIGLYFKK